MTASVDGTPASSELASPAPPSTGPVAATSRKTLWPQSGSGRVVNDVVAFRGKTFVKSDAMAYGSAFPRIPSQDGVAGGDGSGGTGGGASNPAEPPSPPTAG